MQLEERSTSACGNAANQIATKRVQLTAPFPLCAAKRLFKLKLPWPQVQETRCEDRHLLMPIGMLFRVVEVIACVTWSPVEIPAYSMVALNHSLFQEESARFRVCMQQGEVLSREAPGG